MPRAISILRRLLFAVASTTLLIGAITATALADSYGELQHFGSAGKALGSFETAEAHVLGVDTRDNSVYVGDAIAEGKFRIQKFTPGTQGEYVNEKTGKPVNGASVTFEVEKSLESPELEGIAIDPQLEKVYALVVVEREALPVDSEEPAAYALYAFSTKPEGGALKGEVLAGPSVLKTASATQGEALLSPSGITVDPVSHDVIIAGVVDQGPDSGGAPTERAALQRVHATGSLGSRYVDQTDCFGGEGAGQCEETTGTPTSPIVTPTGKVYVQTSNEIWEIPTAENGAKEREFVSGVPTLLFHFLPPDPLQILVNFPGTPLLGGGLSFVSEGGSGTQGKIWAFARIKEDIGPEGEKRTGAVSLKWSEPVAGKPAFAEEGWTGGASASAPACKITGTERAVSAGANGTVFVFDANTASPRIVELGAGGKGCPHTSATTLKAQARGEEVGTKGKPARTADEVTLESTLNQGYVRNVKWNFGDGETSETHALEYPSTKTVHRFKSVGEHEVTATIETDDLAEPTIVKTLKVVVSPSPPNVQFSFPAEAHVNEPAAFDASNSSDPNNAALTQYAWSFGDGAQATSTTAKIQHSYAAVGRYTVTLEVTDAIGQRATISHEVVVGAPSGGGGGGGGGNGGGGGGGGGATNASSSPAPGVALKPPTGGVLSYLVKLASSSLAVAPSGAVTVNVNCAGQSSCTGTVTLRTLSAVSAAASKHKAILTLANGAFSLAGGHAKVVTMHLSSKAKKLLAKSHSLRVRATIVARDASGVTHTTQTTVTLKVAKAKH